MVEEALALAIAADVPVIVWGGPGVGKTASITSMVASRGWPCEVVIASIREPTDFAGLPMITDDGVRFAPPAWARRLHDAGQGVLFLDELSTAPPAVQGALLRVVLERSVGDLPLPPGVRIVAAANPADQAADGWDLAPPLANRFCHLDWDLDARRWAGGMLEGFRSVSIPDIDEERIRGAQVKVAATVSSFIVARPQHLHQVPGSSDRAGRAWPSPRSWTMLIRLLAAAHIIGSDERVTALLSGGCVGPAVAAEFVSWNTELALPDPETVLSDPTSFTLPPRTDRAHALVVSVIAAVVADLTPDRWERGWRAMAAAMRSDRPDIVVSGVRTLLRNRPPRAVPPRDVLAELTPLLRDAGMLDSLVEPTSTP